MAYSLRARWNTVGVSLQALPSERHDRKCVPFREAEALDLGARSIASNVNMPSSVVRTGFLLVPLEAAPYLRNSANETQ